MSSKKLQILGTIGGGDGGNADTLDGKHASEFALAGDVSDLQILVGDTPVSDQIATAVGKKVYSQNDAPTDASDGDIWIDLDEVVEEDPITGLLPTVSAVHNGMFLRVVNGSWAPVTVPSAEGASF